MATTITTTSSDQDQQQRYTDTCAESIREKEKAAKAAYLQMRHNLIEHAVLERKRDSEYELLS